MRSRGVTNLRSSSVTKLPAPESWPPDAWHVPPAPVAPDSRSLVSRLSIRLEARWTGRMKSRAWEGPGRSRGEGCVIASHCPWPRHADGYWHGHLLRRHMDGSASQRAQRVDQHVL